MSTVQSESPRSPWQPPWPPILIGEGEWIVMRDDHAKPAAVIRALRLGARNELTYRVVTWAPTSDARALVGYFRTIQDADQAVLFTPSDGGPRGGINGQAAAPKVRHTAASQTERD